MDRIQEIVACVRLSVSEDERRKISDRAKNGEKRECERL